MVCIGMPVFVAVMFVVVSVFNGTMGIGRRLSRRVFVRMRMAVFAMGMFVFLVRTDFREFGCIVVKKIVMSSIRVIERDMQRHRESLYKNKKRDYGDMDSFRHHE
jgi:hypothetical protein